MELVGVHPAIPDITELAAWRAARRSPDDGGAAVPPPGYSDPAPSPDGTLLAWISDSGGRPRVWVAPHPAGATAVTEPEHPLPTDGDVEAIAWSPDGRWIACQVDPDGAGRTEVHLVAPDGSDRRALAPGAHAATLGVWSPTGRQLGLTIHASVTSSQACLIDVREGTSVVLASGVAPRVCAVSGDGRRVVVAVGAAGERTLELVDLHSGLRTALLPGGARIADARFAVTGSQVYMHTDAGGDRPALLAVTVHSGGVSAAYPVARRPDDDLDLVALDPAGVRAVLSWNVDGRSEVELLDLRSGRLEPVEPVAGDVVTGAAFTRDGNALILANEGPTVPPRLSQVGLDSHGSVTALLRSARSGQNPADPTLQRFGTDNGRRLSGWLFRPDGALGPLPTLIWLQEEERPTFQPLFPALLAREVSVFVPNVPGSAVADVRAALDFLTSTGLATPGRVGLAGQGSGGHLALAALAHHPDRFRVGVDVCGAGPVPDLDALTMPLLVVRGATMTDQVLADATPCRLVLPGEGHRIRGRENRATLIREVVTWVATHLHGLDERSA